VSGPRILVVEDDETTLSVFESALAATFTVVTARDGLEGKRILEEHEDLACVVTDHMMPGLSGIELCRTALALRPNAARVLVTTSARVKDLGGAINLGRVHRFVAKPVASDDLVAVVTDAIRTASLERENARLVAELSANNRQLTNAFATVEAGARKLMLAYAELERLSVRDALTTLYNQRFFREAVTIELSRAARYGNPASVLFIDVDHLANYNEICGQEAGDELLKQIAGRLVATDDIPDVRVRGRLSDVVARYSGEEFVMLLPMTDRHGATARGEGLRKLIASHLFPRGEVQPGGVVTVSIGIAAFPRDAHDTAALIKLAEKAMTIAKSGGRNRVVAIQ
jgi:diguanylate cyclase (GGDEF)-like protein